MKEEEEAQMRLLSIVVPCFNEGACIERFIESILSLDLDVAFEFVMIDDGSQDNTLELLTRLSKSDNRIHYVSFSRNFGKESALLAGLEFATGDVVVTMDADLQHRPELLPNMIQGIREGYDCVAVCRTSRAGEPMVRSWFARRFYDLMNRFSDVALVDGSMDYRMMSRQVVDAVLRLRESNRFTKGIYQWVGFRTKWIESENAIRVAGTTKWSFCGLVAYSLRGIVAFSTAPLQLSSFLGMTFCLMAFIYASYIVVKWIVSGDPVSGWPTLMCVVLLLGGLQLFVIGILGTYLAGLYREAKKRPPYLVRDTNCRDANCLGGMLGTASRD